MNAVLIPVRSMTGAKNRLAAAFDDNARTRLTLAMLADMVAAARATRLVDVVYVVSADTALLEHARRLGAETLAETVQAQSEGHRAGFDSGCDEVRGGLNRAVFRAARTLAERGATSVLTIPGDVPLIAPAEMNQLFAAAPSTRVLLVPSASGNGTNGLLTTPPAVIAPRFEGESLAAHARACETAGVDCLVWPLPGFALDIDTLDDLRALAGCGDGRDSARVAADLLAGRVTGALPLPACAAQAPR